MLESGSQVHRSTLFRLDRIVLAHKTSCDPTHILEILTVVSLMEKLFSLSAEARCILDLVAAFCEASCDAEGAVKSGVGAEAQLVCSRLGLCPASCVREGTFEQTSCASLCPNRKSIGAQLLPVPCTGPCLRRPHLGIHHPGRACGRHFLRRPRMRAPDPLLQWGRGCGECKHAQIRGGKLRHRLCALRSSVTVVPDDKDVGQIFLGCGRRR